jgi:tRNA (cmo5U34)-methyltransferase
MYDQRDNGNFDVNPTVEVGKYDRSIKIFTAPYDEIFRQTWCCLAATIPANAEAELLIVGAGTGKEILEFGPKAPHWSFRSVDPSRDMLDFARSKLGEAGVNNRISWHCDYVQNLPETTPCDGATSILVMHFLASDESKLEYLRAIRRHLRPGAPFILVDGCGDPKDPRFMDMVNAWKQYPLLGGVSSETVERAFSEVILSRIVWTPEKRILQLLGEAGFSNIFRFYTGFLYSGWVAIA